MAERRNNLNRSNTMALILESIHTPGTAQMSYLVGDSSAGTAAVIDPRPDCEIYLQLARQHGVAITHIFETHIHADFLSGARELSLRLGDVPIYASHLGGAEYGFSTEAVQDGADYTFGGVTLTARHTPGHTPEHVSYLACETDRGQPFAVFSGDTLFVDSVGRPDLLGEDQTRQLAEQLHDSIHNFYEKLHDGVILYPGHGAGSACGPDIGDRMSSTIGYERAYNPYFGFEDRDAFIDKILANAPDEPEHYRPMKKLNAGGPRTFGHLPPVPALPAPSFKQAVDSGQHVLLDTRDILSFGGGHIPGALNIAGQPEMSVWAGRLLDFDASLLLVVSDEERLDEIVKLLWRTGHDNFAGYLGGGMTAWETAAYPLQELPQLTVHELRYDYGDAQLLDVRAPGEWQQGHIPGAQHIFVPELPEKASQLYRSKPTVTYCGSGFRANIAASMLQRLGFEDVHSVPGSMKAWKMAGYPVDE
ncbi:MAG: beta-lactamase domain-containing protein [Puniceicoccaceae bacterium 5H]|nr:MAG: beta-lactamase domain-containing protein [Puniceicoccaceae bacterium 5H]